jgi:hypothetical protein
MADVKALVDAEILDLGTIQLTLKGVTKNNVAFSGSESIIVVSNSPSEK